MVLQLAIAISGCQRLLMCISDEACARSTIGIRSGKYAQELMNRGGFAKVYNLKGSIVAWVSMQYAVLHLLWCTLSDPDTAPDVF